MMRRRRPLMRAAMVGGGAYAMGKHRERNQTAEAEQEQSQDERISQLEQQQAPAPVAPAPVAAAPVAAAPAAGGDMVSQLKELSALKDAGALSEAEFEAAKQKLLAS